MTPPSQLPLVVIRPQPGNDATAALARRQEWEVITAPLFAVEPLPWPLPDALRHDALLIGSANALRHGGIRLAALRHLPVYAVGRMTADAARRHGFSIAHTGSGGLESLLPVLKADRRRAPLWLSGEDHVPLPHGNDAVTRIAVYASRPLPMLASLTERLRQPAIILLHSARAAAYFREQCTATGIGTAHLALACFGPRVAAAAGPGWAAVETADAYSDKALLETARRLCKKL